MSSNNYPIIAIGASIASISFIRTLRLNNDTRRVLLVHGEDRLPYKRTKINKHMVRGFDKDDFKMADNEWYVDNNVDLIYDRVTDIARDEKYISTQKGAVYSYEKLLLATGAAAVVPSLSGVDKSEIHGVQNAYDVDKVLEACVDKKRFLIIGGGVEGIETADQLIRKGKEVILASRMKWPLQKMFPPTLIETLEQNMHDKGVQFYKGVSVNAIQKVGEAYQVNLKGQSIAFDVILACTGAVPNSQLATKAGLKTERGIIVDEYLNTSDASILAAGDVAQHAGGVVTGLWHVAEHQGQLAALNVIGKPEAHTLPPFRLKTEVFGLFMFSGAYEAVIPGACQVNEERFGAIHRVMYYHDDKLKAAVFINDKDRAKEYQKALMEHWEKAKVEAELPLPPKISFAFSPA